MANEQFTAENLLAQVNAAILAIAVGGQSYSIGSRSLTRANLTELRNLKNELEIQVSSSQKNNLFSDTYVAFFEGR